MSTDRVLSGAPDGRLYRVVAGEAFSWTTLLIEDQLGERFLLDTMRRSLEPITDSRAGELLETRSFRPWNGPARWASVAEPLADRGMDVAADGSAAGQRDDSAGYVEPLIDARNRGRDLSRPRSFFVSVLDGQDQFRWRAAFTAAQLQDLCRIAEHDQGVLPVRLD